MKSRIIACLVLMTLTAAFSWAQTPPKDARQFRAGLVAEIESGRILPEAALAQLKQRRSIYGAEADADADQGQAALDMAHHLLDSKPEHAKVLFAGAEGAFTAAIKRAADPAAKANLLVNRAQIRSRYLNKKEEASKDLEEAVALRPDDKYVRNLHDRLKRRDAQFLQAGKKR